MHLRTRMRLPRGVANQINRLRRRHRRLSLAWSITLLVALVPTSVLAAEVVTGADVHVFLPTDGDLYAIGSDVLVTADVDGDVIAIGARVTIQGDVSGDVLAAGADVLIVGHVGGSVSATGGTITVAGEVGDTVRAAAETLRVLDSTVQGDVAALARNVRVDGSGHIGGDVLLRATDVRITTGIDGDVRGTVGEMNLSGTIRGAIDVRSDRLRLINGARVEGPITTTSDRDVHIDSTSSVSQPPIRLEPDHPRLSERLATSSVWAILRAGWGVVLGLVLLKFVPNLVRGSAQQVQTRPLGSLGFGVLALIAVPLTIAMLLITVVGIPVALIGMALFITALYASQVIVGYALGALIIRQVLPRITLRRRRPRRVPLPPAELLPRRDGLALAIGVLALATLRSLPIEQWYPFVAGTTAIIGLGALVLQIQRMRSGEDTLAG